MATLAADEIRRYELGDLNHIPVIAAEIIYEGAAVGEVAASGHARPLQGGDAFLGFAERKADNSAGAATDIDVTVRTHGRVQLPIATLAAVDVGVPIYASDDNTFTKTSTSNTKIGTCIRFVSSGVGIVEFKHHVA